MLYLQKAERWFIEVKIAITSHPPLSLCLFLFSDLDSVKNTTWPWLTSCWMIRSWQPENPQVEGHEHPADPGHLSATSAGEPHVCLKASPQETTFLCPCSRKFYLRTSQDALPPPVLPLRQLFKTLRGSNIFFHQGKLKPSSWKHQVLLEGCELGWKQAMTVPHQFPVLPSDWRMEFSEENSVCVPSGTPNHAGFLGRICKPYCLFLVLKRRTAFHR